jgi:UDP-N-acetylmuramate dehydrogenase
MKIEQNVSLKSFNTFGIECLAGSLFELHAEEQLKEYLFSPQRSRGRELILGGGSNILFTGDFDGMVIHNKMSGIGIIAEDRDTVTVKAGAGEVWHKLVCFCVDNNLAGIENLSLIPGTCGAAPIQNIGAYGVELKDVFESLDAIDLNTGENIRMKNSECNFGYRNSVFKNEFKGRYIITAISLKLQKKAVFQTSYGAIEEELKNMGVMELSIKAISDAVCNIRRSKLPDPAEIGNAGSFFKNPEISKEQYKELADRFKNIVAYPVSDSSMMKLAAGWLIEQCGWKGKRFGNVGVHPKQALVLVNYGGGSGKEILDLSQNILDSVSDTFGILLEREVNIV